jgi:acetylornithine deacetylase/succinyl-diaminopimelate desuccinylase family protein
MKKNDGLTTTLFQQIDKNADFLVDLVCSMVRIPTVNPKFEQNDALNREADFQNFLEPVLQELGFRTEQSVPVDLPGRPNLIGVWEGAKDRSLTLCGHVDVVPIGDRSLWTVDPFAAETKNGRIYGRGSLDMKGGLAAYLIACKSIKESGIKLHGELNVHAVVDEEAGGFGCMDLLNRYTPGKAVLIGEPTYGAINPSEGGLEWVRVSFRGKNSHAGWRYNSIYPQRPETVKPAAGVNALELGVLFLNNLRELEREWGLRKHHPNLPPGITTINPGVMIAGVGMDADGRPEITSNPAMTPDNCIIEFDLKFLPSETKEQVRHEFESFVHHFCQQYSWLRENPAVVTWDLAGLHFPPLNTPQEHRIVQSMMGAMKQLDIEPKIEGFVAVSDAAHYAGAGCDGIIYGPNGDGFHGIDEYVEIDSLVEVAKVAAVSIVDWCGQKT